MKSIKDSYSEYLKLDSKNKVCKKIYGKIAADYNKFLVNKVLQGKEVTLPERIGILSIRGKKQKVRLNEEGKLIGLAPDWVRTKELWDSSVEAKENKQIVYHLNSDTDGVRYKFFWSKMRVPIENKTLYSLRMTRENKRAVHKKIKEGYQYVIKI